MAALNWDYDQLVQYSKKHPDPSGQDHLDPMIKELLSTHPGSSVYTVTERSVVLQINPSTVAKVPIRNGGSRVRREQDMHALLDEFKCPAIVRCQSVLATAAASLEVLNYAHGDINPSNIVFDERDNLKLVDFSQALRFGDNVDAGCEPYVRQRWDGSGGKYGVAGPDTEQFALGSVFWYMIQRDELYSHLGPSERTRLLREGIFPVINDKDPVERIIQRCWNAQYKSLEDLVSDIKKVP